MHLPGQLATSWLIHVLALACLPVPLAAVRLVREEVTTTFDGQGYINLDLSSDAWGLYGASDTISLLYRTRQKTAFLIYAGSDQQTSAQQGKRDFIALSLRDGSLLLDMSMNRMSRNATIQPAEGNPLQFVDSKWHRLMVKRKYEKDKTQIQVEVIFDDKVIKMVTIQQPAHLISKKLYLGGYKSVLQDYGSIDFFKGCMREARVKSEGATIDLLRFARDGKHGVSTVGMPASAFGRCEDPHVLQPIRFRAPGSHLAIRRDPANAWSHTGGAITQLSFNFTTNEPDALLLFVGSNHSDFLAFEIRDHELLFLIDAGAGTAQRQITDSRYRLNSSRPNRIEFRSSDTGRGGHSVTLNGNRTVRLDGDAKFRQFRRLDLSGRLYIGGLPASKRFTTPPELQSATLGQGFAGLVANLTVNGEGIDLVQEILRRRMYDVSPTLVDIPSADDSQKLQPLSPRERHCRSRPCENGGACREGWDRFVCTCYFTNFTGPTCSEKAKTLKFDGNGWVKVGFAAPLRTLVEDVVLRFRTNASNGLLLTTVNRKSASQDFMRLSLRHGTLTCSVNYGGGSMVVFAHQCNILHVLIYNKLLVCGFCHTIFFDMGCLILADDGDKLYSIM